MNKGMEGIAMCFVRIEVHEEKFGKDDLEEWECFRLDRVEGGEVL